MTNSFISHPKSMCDYNPFVSSAWADANIELSNTYFVSTDINAPAILRPRLHPNFLTADNPNWVVQIGKPVSDDVDLPIETQVAKDNRLACTSDGFTYRTMVFKPGLNSSPANTNIQGTPGLFFQERIELDLEAAGVTDPHDYSGEGWDNAGFWYWDGSAWQPWPY